MTLLKKALKKLEHLQMEENYDFISVKDVKRLLEELAIDMENEFMGTTLAKPSKKNIKYGPYENR